MRNYKIQPSEEIDQEEPIKSAEDLVETLVPGLSKADYEKIRSDALEKAKTTLHEWRMRGRGKLVCTSCPIPHTSYIPTNKIMTGIDVNGNPLLKTTN